MPMPEIEASSPLSAFSEPHSIHMGVGKNKIIDRLCQRPREYIQLHRDSTVQQLMFQTTLECGVVRYTDPPLLRAVAHGRVLVVDEVDKAPEHVVTIFRSLAGQGELTLTGGASPTTRKAKKPLDMQFDPQKTDLDKLKHGQEDPSGEAHTGGNTFAGSTGGRDTVGLGGHGGFKHLHKKDHNINQAGRAPRVISNKLKEDVPESVREHACLMARKELEVHLAELNMTSAGADSYGALLTTVQAHIAQLHNLLEHAYYFKLPFLSPVMCDAQTWLPVKRNASG
ncbi:hypothetical protein EDB84DRAFT_1556607 [Lactarius hengduanensis]|nr:hypothetical protein EDB84DRAFT_1556607 [Lactarius hengduanensis]